MLNAELSNSFNTPPLSIQNKSRAPEYLMLGVRWGGQLILGEGIGFPKLK